MRIAWAIPCGWARNSSTPGLCDLFDCQKDTVLVGELGTEIEFDVVIRVVGSEADFAREHSVRVALSAQLAEVKAIDVPVPLLVRARHRLPGYELSTHVGARIAFSPGSEGGYDLTFAVDGGEPDHRHDATISVRLLDSN